MDTLHIIEYTDQRREWDGYVRSSPTATVYHQIGWKKIIEDSFGHKAYYLMAKENGTVKGILPLFLIRSKISGRVLVSIPQFIAGVCADNEGIENMLVTEAIKITKQVKADFLELRQFCKVGGMNLPHRNHKASFLLDISPGLETIWKDFKKQVRNRIKKGQQKNFTVKFGDEYLGEFYHCFASQMKKLGVPVYGYQFFRSIMEEFPHKVGVALILSSQKKIMGAKFFIFFKDKVVLLWGATFGEFRCESPNYFFTWEVIKYAYEKGCKYCNFGRSTIGTGPYYFKQQWRAQCKNLYWQYYLNSADRVPDFTPSNPKYRLAIEIWKRLPLFLTKMVGPKVVRFLP